MKNGQTILLLHGWIRGKNARTTYHKTIEEFEKEGFTVFTPDMPGFGEAPIPTHPLTLNDYSEFLRSFINTHNIKSPILIGHSFGGRVIIKYVSSQTTDVQAIVLSGTPGYSPVKKVKWAAFLIISKIGKILFMLPGLEKIADRIRGWFYYIAGARDFYRAQGPMRQTFKNIVGEGIEEGMKKIKVPTLLVWGEEDSIVPVRIAHRMKETISQSKLTIIPHVGHKVLIDESHMFVKEVLSFLQSL
jgi:pimeloyl-ACP methyl ester carboxylesterase